MALDIHRVRQISTQSDRKVKEIKRDVTKVLDQYQSLGSSFTADRLYSREYSKLTDSVREANRALDKLIAAINEIQRKA